MIYVEEYFHPFNALWVVNRLQILKCIMLEHQLKPRSVSGLYAYKDLKST